MCCVFQAGNHVRDDVVSSTIQLMSDCGPELQASITADLWRELSKDKLDRQPLVQIATWAIGEFGDLLVKDESFNPTQSFKARGMSAAITRAAALGVTAVALPSAGNAGGAAAAYAACAGMKCVIFMPDDTPPANILESECGGAQVCLVNGLISDCGRLCRAACDRFGWFDLSTLKEPFRLEGKKTMATSSGLTWQLIEEHLLFSFQT